MLEYNLSSAGSTGRNTRYTEPSSPSLGQPVPLVPAGCPTSNRVIVTGFNAAFDSLERERIRAETLSIVYRNALDRIALEIPGMSDGMAKRVMEVYEDIDKEVALV